MVPHGETFVLMIMNHRLFAAGASPPADNLPVQNSSCIGHTAGALLYQPVLDQSRFGRVTAQ